MTTVQGVKHADTKAGKKEAKAARKAAKKAARAAAAKAPREPRPPETKPGAIEILVKGIWKENPGLCQLLGLCPLLAVTNSAANAMGLAAATMFVLLTSSIIVSILRTIIFREVRIPLYIVLIATLVSFVMLMTEAYFPNLYESLGIYLALIVTNCIIMGRAEAFAGRHDVYRSFLDAFANGIGFALVLFAIGSLREIIGSGTWFAGTERLFGEFGAGMEIKICGDMYTYLIAILPPGGFFALGFLIAMKNFIDNFRKNKRENKYKIRSLNV